MRLILAGIALLFVVGCKVNQSQLADSGNSSGAVCSPELAAARVKGQGSTQGSGDTTGLALNGEDQKFNALVNEFTYSKLDPSFFLKAKAAINDDEKNNNIGLGCQKYGDEFANIQCQETGSCSWWGFDRPAERQKFKNAGEKDCTSSFHDYFNSQSSADSLPPHEQPSGEPETQPEAKGPEGPISGPENEPCTMPTAARLTDVSYSRPYCELLGGSFLESEIGEHTCQCPSGPLSMADLSDRAKAAGCKGGNTDPRGFQACMDLGPGFRWELNKGCVCIANSEVSSGSAWGIKEQLKGQCAAAAAPTAAANPPAPVKVAPTAVPPKPNCDCVQKGNQCQKVLDGKVVASLTIQNPNPVTKMVERCDRSGHFNPNLLNDRYTNLCNQPQITCGPK